MSAPLLSIVLPARNAAGTLGSTLRSVADQGFSRDELEVIAVDDGSGDATGEEIDAFRDALSLTVLRHEEPRGVSAARNEGAARARGAFLTFLDADDWYGPGHLRDLVGVLESTGADFARADYVRVTGSRRQLVEAPAFRRGVPLDPQDFVNPATTSTMVDFPNCWSGMYAARLRDKGLLHFDESLATSEDRLMTWRLHLHAESFAVAGSRNMFYRKGSERSLTGIYDERQLDFIPAFRRILAEVDGLGLTARFGVKVVRSFLGITHYQRHHRYDAMDEPVRRRFAEGIVALLRDVPAATVREALVDFGQGRVELIDPLLRKAGITP